MSRTESSGLVELPPEPDVVDSLEEERLDETLAAAGALAAKRAAWLLEQLGQVDLGDVASGERCHVAPVDHGRSSRPPIIMS